MIPAAPKENIKGMIEVIKRVPDPMMTTEQSTIFNEIINFAESTVLENPSIEGLGDKIKTITEFTKMVNGVKFKYSIDLLIRSLLFTLFFYMVDIDRDKPFVNRLPISNEMKNPIRVYQIETERGIMEFLTPNLSHDKPLYENETRPGEHIKIFGAISIDNRDVAIIRINDGSLTVMNTVGVISDKTVFTECTDTVLVETVLKIYNKYVEFMEHKKNNKPNVVPFRSDVLQ